MPTNLDPSTLSYLPLIILQAAHSVLARPFGSLMMLSTLSLFFSLASMAVATPCVGFDGNWGLYVFGLNQDVSLGPSSNWGANPLQGSVLTKEGRPPFNTNNTQCFFSQYQNALYVLSADSTQPSNMHIFSFDSQAWTTQQLSASGTDPYAMDVILDRDTNVFFALSHSQLYSLDMGNLRAADGSSRSWQYVQDPPFAQNNAYPNPVMALGQNHIHFLNIGKAAQVNIFVIHFSFSQPDTQTFAPMEPGGQGFPSTHGQTATIFKGVADVPSKFVFIPDDGSSTFIFDTGGNTTQAMPAPIDKSISRLAASQREIVQMTSTGDVWWIPFSPDDPQPNYGAAWNKLHLTLSQPTTPGGSGNSSGGANGTTTHTGSGTSTGASSAPSGTRSSSVEAKHLSAGLMAFGLGLCGLWTLLY